MNRKIRSCLLMISGLLFVVIGQGSVQAQNTKRDPSQNPPGGLRPFQVPMFVSIGFDDNQNADVLEWLLEYSAKKRNHRGSKDPRVYDGEPYTFSFYPNGLYAEGAAKVWKKLQDAGHELGNHSYSHPMGVEINWGASPATYKVTMSIGDWNQEIVDSEEAMQRYGKIAKNTLPGFRVPYGEVTNEAITAIIKNGYKYDASIAEGFQTDQNGTNFFWPYTLHNGSPGDKVKTGWFGNKPMIRNYPGLWELPIYAFILPPDSECRAYGAKPGIRKKVKAAKPYINQGNGWKISGQDYNLFHKNDGSIMLGPEEVAAVFKYNLDIRLKGNRAPLMAVGHTAMYTTKERKKALMNFLDYAASKKDVRIVSNIKILKWLENPVPLYAGKGNRVERRRGGL